MFHVEEHSKACHCNFGSLAERFCRVWLQLPCTLSILFEESLYPLQSHPHLMAKMATPSLCVVHP